MTISNTKNFEEKIRELSRFFMNIPFFTSINNEEIKLIAKHISYKAIGSGDILFSESDKGSYLGFITQGALNVIAQNDKNESVVIACIQQGELIGEMSIIENLPRSATVQARVDTELYILSKSAFDLIVERHPHAGVKLLQGVSHNLSQHLRETTKKLAQKSLKEGH